MLTSMLKSNGHTNLPEYCTKNPWRGQFTNEIAFLLHRNEAVFTQVNDQIKWRNNPYADSF